MSRPFAANRLSGRTGRAGPASIPSLNVGIQRHEFVPDAMPGSWPRRHRARVWAHRLLRSIAASGSASSGVTTPIPPAPMHGACSASKNSVPSMARHPSSGSAMLISRFFVPNAGMRPNTSAADLRARNGWHADRDFARHGKSNPVIELRQISPTGKSLLIFRNGVKPRNQKYSCFRLTQITSKSIAVSSHQRGDRASSRARGGMRWT